MEALDILEKRIDALTRVLGPVQDSEVGEGVVDALCSAHAILGEATTGSAALQQCVKRSDELEKYLDPNFLEEHQQVRSKEVYLQAVAPELHTQAEQLERIKQLEPALGAEYFRSIPAGCLEQLKGITQNNGEYAQQSELIEESLVLAMKRYGEIQAGLLSSLDAMSERLDQVEERMEQRKRAELSKDVPPKD
uniref:CG9893 protein n=1 Tax=Drosophila melanogaster TaxID=7227 RepID=A0AQB7_DROME|nr:CG9893 [Drosophila melanogaster]